jgi:hypothetical protein
MTQSNVPKYYGIAVVAMAVAAIVTGLVLAGSPSSQRELRFDQQRMNELQQISSAVDQYHVLHGTLPASLEILTDPAEARFYYIASLVDPETKAPYEYSVTGETSYKLCATFTRATDGSAPSRPVMDPYNRVWNHGAGHHCYELVTPPQMPDGGVKPVPAPIIVP